MNNAEHWFETIARYLSRIAAALESRPCCNASHACTLASAPPSSPSSWTGSSDSYASPSPVSDAARRALADPNRPKWLTREMCERLPEGTERVALTWGHDRYAYPGKFVWALKRWWTRPEYPEGSIQAREVYHVPPPTKDDVEAVTDPDELARIMATSAFREAVADAIRRERNAP